MKKKILIVTPFFVPAYSYWWIVKVAYEQAIGLKKIWNHITVLTTDVLDSKSRIKKLYEIIDWIEIIRFRNLFNKCAKFCNLYLPLWYVTWLRKNIKEYDVVHIHDIYNILTYFACFYSFKYWIKYYIQPHWVLSNIRIKSRFWFIKKIILKYFKMYFDNANGFFALTEQEKSEIWKVTSNNNIIILPNWINLQEFKNVPKLNLYKKYNLSKNCLIFIFLWRIQYIKWLDVSLKLLADYNKNNKNWKYIIVWPDEWEQKKLMKLSKELKIDKNIIWYWMSTWLEKLSLLVSSDVFLFTSRAEWFPMTILEALACKLPVFISKWCNFPEINSCKCGEIIDINDKNNINIQKLNIFLKNLANYKKNIEGFIEKYDIKKILVFLDKLYEK